MGAKWWTGWLFGRRLSFWRWRNRFGRGKRLRRRPPLRAVLDLATFVAVVSVKAWTSKRLWDRWRSTRSFRKRS